jgi:hypothetical protein
MLWKEHDSMLNEINKMAESNTASNTWHFWHWSAPVFSLLRAKGTKPMHRGLETMYRLGSIENDNSIVSSEQPNYISFQKT